MQNQEREIVEEGEEFDTDEEILSDEESAPSVVQAVWMFGSALVLFGLAYYLFMRFTQMEASGEHMKIWWLLWIAYKIGGKWLATIICSLGGLGAFAAGIYECSLLLEQRKARALEDDT